MAVDIPVINVFLGMLVSGKTRMHVSIASYRKFSAFETVNCGKQGGGVRGLLSFDRNGDENKTKEEERDNQTSKRLLLSSWGMRHNTQSMLSDFEEKQKKYSKQRGEADHGQTGLEARRSHGTTREGMTIVKGEEPWHDPCHRPGRYRTEHIARSIHAARCDEGQRGMENARKTMGGIKIDP